MFKPLFYAPPSLTLRNSTFLCFEGYFKKNQLYPYAALTDWFVFITETHYVYCAVWAPSVKISYSICKIIFSKLCTLTLRLLMSYIYEAPILDVSRSHTTTQHSR